MGPSVNESASSRHCSPSVRWGTSSARCRYQRACSTSVQLLTAMGHVCLAPGRSPGVFQCPIPQRPHVGQNGTMSDGQHRAARSAAEAWRDAYESSTLRKETFETMSGVALEPAYGPDE